MMALAVCASEQRVFAQPTAEEGLPLIGNFTPDHYGVPHGQNWAFVQDSSGILYVGNGNGLLIFDGASWRHVVVGAFSSAKSLAIDDANNVYVGGDGDLGVVRQDSLARPYFESFLAEIPEESRDFSTIWRTFAIDDAVVFAAYEHIYIWRGGRMRVLDPLPGGGPNFHLALSAHSRVFVRQDGIGLLELVDDSLAPVQGGELFAEGRIFAMLPQPAGRILVGTLRRGLFQWDGQTFEPFRTGFDDLLPGQLYGGLVTSSGLVFLATINLGILVVDASGKPVKRIDTESGLLPGYITALFEDAVGSVWAGLGVGISRIRYPSPISHYGPELGLFGQVQAVERWKSSLYVGTDQGLFRLDEGRQGQLPNFVEVTGVGPTFGLASLDNHLVVATMGRGTAVFDGGSVRILDPTPVFDLHAERGRIFAGLQGGIGVIDNRSGQPEMRLHAALEGDVTTLAQDDYGSIWAGLESGGPYRVDSLRGVQGPLGPDQGLPDTWARVFSAGGEVRLAFPEGLFRWADQEFVPDSTFLGMTPETSVTYIETDRADRVWVYEPGRFRVFTGNGDGPHGEIALPLGSIQVGEVWRIKAEEGAVWVGGSRGLARVDASVDVLPPSPFPAQVRRVVVASAGPDIPPLFGGHAPAGYRRPELEHAFGRLVFHYAAPGLGDSTSTQYSYLLDDFDGAWSSWSSESHTDYTNIGAGQYTFRVRGRDSEGRQSEDGEFGFVVLPPWYQSWWAYLIYLTLTVGVVVGIVRLWTWRLAERNRRLEKVVAERTREVDRMHREYTSFIRHELNNAIAPILGYAEMLTGQPPVAKSTRQKWAGKILERSKSMSELLDSLKSLQDMERGDVELADEPCNVDEMVYRAVQDIEATFGDRVDIDFRSEAPDAIVLGDSGVLPGVFVNLLKNAAEHVGNLASRTERVITVRLWNEEGALTVAVNNKGEPIPVEKLDTFFEKFNSSKRGLGGTGLGTSYAHLVTTAHSGSISVASDRESGTTVTVRLPLAASLGTALRQEGAAVDEHRAT